MLLSLEVLATIFGLVQGITVLLNKRSNWIFYIAQMLCLIFFALCKKLYGDFLNACIYLILGVVGWFVWNEKVDLKITKCCLKEKLIYIILIVLGTLMLYIMLRQTTDPLPLMDSFTTISSFVATYYMLRKKIDTWIIWFINDICYIVQYALLPQPAYYLLVLNIVWTIMAVCSYIYWQKQMVK
ncbi:MAG: nicotinamide mononucleotide transporter [Alphaproteobacteria bacterium]|nr:nicotinamide mononucleotide transporter [Alphaproteobacteria bacterium]